MVNVKESAPESEEQKFKQKCSELKKRILEIEESNEISTIALSRTRLSIRRLRLEHAVLLERLEEQIMNTSSANEMMSQPPNPTLLDDSISIKVKSGLPKTKKGKLLNSGNATAKKAIRDPDLPKRPTNAYLMFCDREKDKIRNELTTNNTGKSTGDLSKILTDTWKGLDEEEKKPYQLLYEEDRERYKREMEEYNKRKQDQYLISASGGQKPNSEEELEFKRTSDSHENSDIKRQRVDASFEPNLEAGEDDTVQDIHGKGD